MAAPVPLLVVASLTGGDEVDATSGVIPQLLLEEFQLSLDDSARAVCTWGVRLLHAAMVRLGRGPRHASALDALRRISFALRSRCSHLESGALFPLTLYLAVIVPGVWVLLLSAEIGFFGRFLFSWVQNLVRQWIHALRQYFGGFGRNTHIFYFAADSNPEVLLSLLLQNGEACPVDASGCSFALRGSHLEN